MFIKSGKSDSLGVVAPPPPSLDKAPPPPVKIKVDEKEAKDVK